MSSDGQLNQALPCSAPGTFRSDCVDGRARQFRQLAMRFADGIESA